MNPPQPEISVAGPVEPALERVKQMLFRPFKLDKWIAIGFCAWLANLGAGGSRFNTSFPWGNSSNTTNQTREVGTQLDPALAHARIFLHNNLWWIVPFGIAVALVCLAVGVVLLWLRSRGDFMFLHCVALDRAEVKAPWAKYEKQAHSLWLFRLALAAAGLVVLLPILAIIGWNFWELIATKGHPGSVNPVGILLIFVFMMALVFIMVAFSIVGGFTSNFVVPIMYLRGCTCTEGWRELRQLMSGNGGRFCLYVLFQIVLRMGIAIVVVLFVACTLLIGGLLLLIPFVGTVVLLPVLVFKRSYPLYYLAQYGAEFNVFAQPPPPPPLP